MKQLEFVPEINVRRGVPKANSVDVARHFDKSHKDVLKAIRELDCSSDFNRRNFAPIYYVDKMNRNQPMYEMTRDGFVFLAMGFTGKKAAEWKEKYIETFNVMEATILQMKDGVLVGVRVEGKIARFSLTDVIQQFVEYADSQGSNNAKWYFTTITKATYTIFEVQNKTNLPLRDMLNIEQLSYLRTTEFKIRDILIEGMGAGLHYKKIYKLVKRKIDAVAEVVGVTPVISTGQQVRSLAA